MSRRGFLTGAAGLLLAGTLPASPSEAATGTLPTRSEIVEEFAGRKPHAFGMFLPGTLRHGARRICLTFDACGGPRGSHYDAKIIKTLRKAHVPATVFLNSRWIAAHPHVAKDLAEDPLFELGNHGWLHRPLTVAGQSAYGIKGTASVGEAYDEIARGLHAVADLTGKPPRWYRPGTAWADDVGIAIARRLGLQVVSFSINVDEGATASKARIVSNLEKARSGDITLAHVNQPHGKTAEGLTKALPKLLHAGRTFGTLSHDLA